MNEKPIENKLPEEALVVSNLLRVVAHMPSGLNHNPDRGNNQPFDIMRSEVVAWISKQPEVMEWLFRKVVKSGLIKFDQSTRLWFGTGEGTGKTIEFGRSGRPTLWKEDDLMGVFLTREVAEGLNGYDPETFDTTVIGQVGNKFWISWALGTLGMSRPTFYKLRARLIRAGKIEFWRHPRFGPVADIWVKSKCKETNG